MIAPPTFISRLGWERPAGGGRTGCCAPEDGVSSGRGGRFWFVSQVSLLTRTSSVQNRGALRSTHSNLSIRPRPPACARPRLSTSGLDREPTRSHRRPSSGAPGRPRTSVWAHYVRLVKRFDGFLERVSRESEPPEEQRGILLLAHSEMRERLESISRKFHHMGTRWGEVRFLVKCRGSRRRRIAATSGRRSLRKRHGVTSRRGSLDNSIESILCSSGPRGSSYGLFHLAVRPWDCPCPACVTRQRGREKAARAEESVALDGPRGVPSILIRPTTGGGLLSFRDWSNRREVPFDSPPDRLPPTGRTPAHECC